ncbi:MAG: leucine--tRNA ligase [Anaerolineales bacterium]|nr:leucine--tRNA ligase [Anaerolineales bacterium]
MSKKYNFEQVEAKWQPVWEAMDLYAAGHDPDKPDRYILDFFPYPSGSGLSVGHARNYVPTCVSARFMRMQGYNVLHPMGWDAFGLPAENYAITHNIHPRESTRLFCDTYRRQMKLLECSYDWAREINSTHPDYYRWTQWFFLLLHERGLAYQALGEQWWCPGCQTILANEQVENGRCWRCDHEVTKKALQQWYFKITEYADRLLADLDTIDWPEPIKLMQRNWIGRSEGAEVVFQTAAGDEIAVFTTRPDTLFGVTFLALAPEHPLVAKLTTAGRQTAVSDYIAQSRRKSDIDRQATNQAKTGVFTGSSAIHPLTGQPVPVWVADYVLMGYGSGAVMGVPGHDERDFAFAQQPGLETIEVITPDGRPQGVEACFSDYGVLINSGDYSGMDSQTAVSHITADLAASGKGRQQVSYKLRDWLISRQRYWGAPIPIVHCQSCGAVPVPADQLPVELPDIDDFAPSGNGRSPLARAADWVNTPCPRCGQPAQRETDTMDGFACSSWYFLRFASPRYEDGPFDPAAVARWLPVDTYVGGAEHAVMHLLYARFWTKVMFDAGLISFTEPFTQLRNQGMLLSNVDGRKMSKSRGNVVTPDEVAAQYGTDALRGCVLFLGPFDAEVTWEETAVRGVARFLDRFWRLVGEVAQEAFHAKAQRRKESKEFERRRHELVQRLTHDMAQFRFNTAVAALMEHLNYLLAAWEAGEGSAAQWQEMLNVYTRLLAPIAPFISEEVWQAVLGQPGSVHQQSWPSFEAAKAAAAQVTVVVQVNGKVRDRIVVDVGEEEGRVKQTAVSSPKVQQAINGQAIHNIIIIPQKLVNIVAG